MLSWVSLKGHRGKGATSFLTMAKAWLRRAPSPGRLGLLVLDDDACSLCAEPPDDAEGPAEADACWEEWTRSDAGSSEDAWLPSWASGVVRVNAALAPFTCKIVGEGVRFWS